METQAKERGGVSRFIYFSLAGVFTICVAVQIFIAGMAIFTDASYWYDHIVFVRIFELFPILMLIFAFTGRMPHYFRWMSAVLFLLIYAQYFTANFPGAGAFHPLIAAVLLVIVLQVAMKAGRIVLKAKEAKH